MPIYDLEIYDEGQSQGFWKSIGLNRPENPADSSIKVKSVEDMVTKVLAATEKQPQKIDIYLKGAGKTNFQSVGAGAAIDPAGDKSLQADSKGELNQAAKTWLPRLIGRISGIYLMGIEEKGSFPLLNALAKLLNGVHIRGQFGEGLSVVYFPNTPARPLTMRTSAERQQLRDSLKKLDQK